MGTLLSTIILINNIAFSQISDKITLLQFESLDKNSKTIVLKKQKINNERFFIFKAFNKKTHDIQTCVWQTKLDVKKTKILINQLSELSIHNKIKEGYFYKLILKNNFVKLIFKHSKCIGEHKLFYFQKDCKRNFSLKMSKEDSKRLLLIINNHLKE